jgi:hypothetical protein
MNRAPLNDPKHAEVDLKRRELIQREYQILGDYLREVRSLGVSIGTMTLAVAGGMLTLSVGQVLKGDGIELPIVGSRSGVPRICRCACSAEVIGASTYARGSLARNRCTCLNAHIPPLGARTPKALSSTTICR